MRRRRKSWNYLSWMMTKMRMMKSLNCLSWMMTMRRKSLNY